MSPEERRLLEKTVALSEENNKILRKMRRTMLFSSVTRWIYWIVIIGISVGAYYVIQPYINMLTDSLQSITGAKISTPIPIQTNMSVLNAALENLKAITQ